MSQRMNQSKAEVVAQIREESGPHNLLNDQKYEITSIISNWPRNIIVDGQQSLDLLIVPPEVENMSPEDLRYSGSASPSRDPSVFLFCQVTHLPILISLSSEHERGMYIGRSEVHREKREEYPTL
ncbi:hypothetical protein C8J56DRAFT_886829 [Mycena floridula]|nr:hypothetical protein C8J56DRAFT_886829 [Mycena floridula]